MKQAYRFRHISIGACLFATCISLLVLLGWAVNRPVFASFYPLWGTMKPNAAVAVIFWVLSLQLFLATEGQPWQDPKRLIASLFASLVSLLGLLTLGEYAFHWQLGFDNVLFSKAVVAASLPHQIPGRIASNGAFCLVFIGWALLLKNKPTNGSVTLQNGLALMGMSIGLLVLIGYVVGITPLCQASHLFVPMAFPSVLCIIALALAQLYSNPTRGIMAIAESNSPGSVIIRYVIPLIAVTLIFGRVVAHAGSQAGLYEPIVGMAGNMFFQLVVNTVVLAKTAAVLHQVYLRRQQAEAENRKLGSVVENCNNFIGMMNLDGTVTYTNPWGWALVGCKDTAVCSGKKHLTDFVYPADREYVLQQVLPAINQAGKWSGEIRMSNCQTQEPIPTYWNAVRIDDPETGRPMALANIAQDLRAQKRHEQMLQERTILFETLAENMPNLASMAHPDGTVFWYNKRWLEYTGMPQEALLGEGWHRACSEAELPYLKSAWAEALAKGEPLEIVHFLKGADGIFRPFLSRAVPIRNDQGRVMRWFATSTDITSELEAKAILEKAKKEAEQANRQKSQFLANMSHELRTPLNAVIGYSEMMLKGLASTPERQEKYAKNISISGHHLLDMVNDILDLSKVEAGKMSLNLERLEVSDLFEQLEMILSPLAQEKDVRLAFSIDMDMLPVMADPTRLRQIFFNLIHNAIKFNRPGGEVYVRAYRAASGMFIGVVEDTGIGIPKDKQAKLFTEFYQVNSEFSRQYGGTGLGLNLTKNLVELFGGSITMLSKENLGTRFTFKLPLKWAQNSAPPEAPPGQGGVLVS